MFRPSLGALGVNVSSIPKIYESRTTELPITYSAGNPMTTRISRQNPIARLECRLTGSYLASTSNATAKPFGIMGVIRSLELRLDGDQLLVNLPGYMLPYHTQFYDAWKPYSKDPLFTTGATSAQQAFEYAFTINLDCGGYMSLLDASRNQELSLKINWGTVDDVATAGGTHAFTTAPQLEVSTVSIIGQDPGLIGTLIGNAVGRVASISGQAIGAVANTAKWTGLILLGVILLVLFLVYKLFSKGIDKAPDTIKALGQAAESTAKAAKNLAPLAVL